MTTEITPQELLKGLIDDGILSKQNKGTMKIEFLNITSEKINNDAVGTLLQSWLENWLEDKKYFFKKPSNSQERPDIYLKKKSKIDGLLEIKAFYNSPGFDLQSWNAFLNLLLINPNHIYADYLIFDYDIINNKNFIIENIFLKKIWELSKPMGSRAKIQWPVNVQYKNSEIVNLRPISAKDMKENKTYFENALDFLEAIQKTIEKYDKSKSEHKDGKWLKNVKLKYKSKMKKEIK